MVLINDKWCVHGCSSQYALRSYLYLLFHEIVGRPASWLFSEDKVSFLLCVVVELFLTGGGNAYGFHVTVVLSCCR